MLASALTVLGLTACTTPAAPSPDPTPIETSTSRLKAPLVTPVATAPPTLAHELLTREHEVMRAVGDADADARHAEAVAALDAFLRRAVERVEALPPDRRPGDVFHAIQSVFGEQDYVLRVPTLLLTDALTTNRYDCDTGSFLFLSVAQRADLPLELIEVPEHNFVRWSSGDDHLNWDVNDATSYTDAKYIDGWYVSRHVDPDSDPTFGGYMVPHTRSHIDGYHDFLLGLYAGRANDAALKERLLLRSIERRPGVGKSLAGLAWLYASHEDFTGEEHRRIALEYGRAAYERLPGDSFFQKVYSCALATNGRFDEAIAFERDHGANEWRLERYAEGADCR
jgi:hypothetical protein